MWSNGSGMQPKSLDEHQAAFNELLGILDMPNTTPASDKLNHLRNVPATALIAAIDKMSNSQFRGVSDGQFVHTHLFANINSGDYARRMRKRGVKLLIGECRDEHNLYRMWRTPQNSHQAVLDRLCEDYPAPAVKNALEIYAPGGRLPAGYTDWKDLFGRVYADLQVHCLERGFVNALSAAGLVVGEDVLRYRIEWRARCADAALPTSWQVTHSSDEAIWWWGNGWANGLTREDKDVVTPLHDLFARFVRGENVEWAQKGPKVVKRLTDRGTLDFWDDERWEEGQAVWQAVNESALKARL